MRLWKPMAAAVLLVLAGCPDDTVAPTKPGDVGYAFDGSLPDPGDVGVVVKLDAEVPVVTDAELPPGDGGMEPTDGEVVVLDDAGGSADDGGTGTDDAGAEPPDGAVAVPDGGPVLAPIGAPCTANGQCLSGMCIPAAAGWPDGYCSRAGCDVAAADTSCLPYGGDGLCLSAASANYCLDQCDPAAPDCRAGYQCSTYGAASLCEPAPVCGDGTVDFPEECEPPNTATCDASCQGTGTDPTGSACADAASCLGNYCIDGWPDGYCTHYGCDPAAPDSCAALGGGVCLDAGGTGVCLQTCTPATTPSGCRTGYDCNDYGAVAICEPTPVCGDGQVDFPEECEPPGTATCDASCVGTGTDPTGAACADAATCAGNYCIAGWPAGYCTYVGCDLASPDTSCASLGGGMCLEVTGDGVCFQTCDPADPAGCRTGYVCNDYGTVALCEPAPVCGDGAVDFPEECEPPNTGTCDANCIGKGKDPTGSACTDAASCQGNYCIDRWPDGYCAHVGCDLASPDTSCDSLGGGVCLEVTGDGVCFQTCDPAANPTGCRTGYACNTYGPVSVCEPAPVCGDGTVDFPEECEPPSTATCDANCVGTGTATTGSACNSAADCAGNYCIDQWLDGYCSAFGCDLASPDTSCGALGGGVCMDVGNEGMCFQTCDPAATPSGCRAGYNCNDYGTVALCEPAPVCGDGVVDPPEECEPPNTASCDADCIGTGTAAVGAACASAADCAGNYCIAEADGFPGGYCTFAGCDLASAATSCSAYGTLGGALCLDIDSSGTNPFGMCFDLCLPLAPDCRTGYRCNTYGLVSICEPGSPSPIGRACVTAADCVSDTCLGAADGWPASGYCAQSGCDLASPSTSCPAGSFCWNIGTAASPRPLCLDTCSQGPTDPCATGLRCVKHGANRLCEP